MLPITYYDCWQIPVQHNSFINDFLKTNLYLLAMPHLVFFTDKQHFVDMDGVYAEEIKREIQKGNYINITYPLPSKTFYLIGSDEQQAKYLKAEQISPDRITTSIMTVKEAIDEAQSLVSDVKVIYLSGSNTVQDEYIKNQDFHVINREGISSSVLSPGEYIFDVDTKKINTASRIPNTPLSKITIRSPITIFALDLRTYERMSLHLLKPSQKIRKVVEKSTAEFVGSKLSVVQALLILAKPSVLKEKFPELIPVIDTAIQRKNIFTEAESHKDFLPLEKWQRPDGKRIEIDNISIDLRNWPEGVIICPDFVSQNNMKEAIFNKLLGLSWQFQTTLAHLLNKASEIGKPSQSLYFGFFPRSDGEKDRINLIPDFINCLSYILSEHAVTMSAANYINLLQITEKGLKIRLDTMLKGRFALLCFGNPIILHMESKEKGLYRIPLLSGSLTIFENNFKNWNLSIMNTNKDLYISFNQKYEWSRARTILIVFGVI